VNDQAIKFITDVVKPWEKLNADLSYAFAINPGISDFTQRAISLALSLTHLPEALAGLKPTLLSKRSASYEVIRDLADSSKHGALRDAMRQSELSVGSLFERNATGQVRFLRNLINLQHARAGKLDFMLVAMEAAVFIADEISVQTSWTPKLRVQSGEFSSKIRVHAGAEHQVMWGGMQLQFVQMRADGQYEPVDLDSAVEFHLTSDF
jgi:hypothetical protein